MYKELEQTEFNPFEVKVDKENLMKNLNSMDERCITGRFKATKDPINLAFESVENTSLKTLAKDFVTEGFDDIVSFITGLCK